MTETQSNFGLFCELTSIRGIQRIRKAQTMFTRVIWSGFVVAMTFSLILTIGFLARDFLSYNTAWHSRTLIDDKTDFPAITLCAHNPFSIEANAIWKKKQILTPTQFNQRLSEITLEFMKHDQLSHAGILLLDSTETYYANLRPEESQNLSHQPDMFPHCMITVDGVRIVAENCKIEGETGFTKRAYSHPRYFNCWTLETAQNRTTNDTARLTLLIKLVPTIKIEEAKRNFIMDTFSRGEGVKLVVHQSGTYPEIDKHGINVQPGRMNELSFQTIQWSRLKTPVAPCIDNPEPIKDMDYNYSYRLTQCLDSILQNISLTKCGCVNSEWPRTVLPNQVDPAIPYCSALPQNPSDPKMLEAMIARLECTDRLVRSMKVIKEKAIRDGRCIPVCSYYTYPISASITSWKPIPEQLAHFTEKCQKVERLQTNPSGKAEFIKYLEMIINSTSAASSASSLLSPSEGALKRNKTLADSFTEEESYTYISLVRTSYDTIYKEERLIFDFYILISRVGGLCSIFVGLTAAFVVEIIEFVYLVCVQSQLHKTTRDRRPTMPADLILHVQNNNTGNNEEIYDHDLAKNEHCTDESTTDECLPNKRRRNYKPNDSSMNSTLETEDNKPFTLTDNKASELC